MDNLRAKRNSIFGTKLILKDLFDENMKLLFLNTNTSLYSEKSRIKHFAKIYNYFYRTYNI